ncbi:hypothetical protein F511_38765 [Dorcoceras hygrometricum]|uniref:Uncharacterized protein n=1 Tax=Dorcoceras hygrometricum TaxID=472368 RepID=A0A2Z7AWW6_9LAMI|nr:hypothetical protein F511_38765 [Dorcoceras hygrometricum]
MSSSCAASYQLLADYALLALHTLFLGIQSVYTTVNVTQKVDNNKHCVSFRVNWFEDAVTKRLFPILAFNDSFSLNKVSLCPHLYCSFLVRYALLE